MVMNKLRLFVADDHPAFRKGLMRMLEEDGVECVGDAADGTDGNCHCNPVKVCDCSFFCNGRLQDIRVPCPGKESQYSLPSTAWARSRMPETPLEIGETFRGLKPQPWS